jgi:2TM domain-containing protein
MEETLLAGTTEDELRRRATRAAYRKRGFRHHLRTYVLVNLLLVGIWAVTGAGYFWPICRFSAGGSGSGFTSGASMAGIAR